VNPLLLLKDTICAAGQYVANYFLPVAGAALAAIGQYFVDTAARGKADTMDTGDFWIGVAVQGVTGLVSSGAGAAAGAAGSAVSSAAGTGFGAAVAGVAVSSTLGYISSVGTQLAATALAYGKGALRENYDEILVNGAISAGIGAAVSIGASGGSAVMGAVGDDSDATDNTKSSGYQSDSEGELSSLTKANSIPSNEVENPNNKVLVVIGHKGWKGGGKWTDYQVRHAKAIVRNSDPGSKMVDLSSVNNLNEGLGMIEKATTGEKFDRVFFLAHGSEEEGGSMMLGNAWVNGNSEADMKSLAHTLDRVLTQDGGVGLYTCKTGRGADFLPRLWGKLGGSRWVAGFKSTLYSKVGSNNSFPWSTRRTSGYVTKPGAWAGFEQVYMPL
jgi:hypothetical protein